MSALREQLMTLLGAPEAPVNAAWVDEVERRYPYFRLPSALLLARNEALDSDARRQRLEHVALYATDREAFLALSKAADGANAANFYPPEERVVPTTNDAIATFLDNYGHQSQEEDAMLERLIFNPVPDYAGVLEAEAQQQPAPAQPDEQANEQDVLIDAFIAKMTPVEPYTATEPEPEPEPDTSVPVDAPTETDPSTLQESLAKTYIKMRRYAKAYEIISNLNLNFPEKSIYFADQLRFLQKLMEIEAKKAKK